eukprot:27364_1
MATGCDAVITAKILNNIKSISKDKLLLCLSSMTINDLKDLIFTSMKISNPEWTNLIDNIWFNQTDNDTTMDNHCNHIKEYFMNEHNTKQNTNKMNKNNPFTSLPTSIGSYIISYNNMKDRLNCQLISTDLYTFCHLPMAKYHLIIDHKFVKALYLKHINYKKYFNVQYLDVKYVLKVDSHYECFGEQYYSIISEII